MKPRIYADFHNADQHGRLRLNCVGTTEDLSRRQIELREGLELTFYSDDSNMHGDSDELLVDGVVSFSKDEQCWVASIDWKGVRHASDECGEETNVHFPRL